VSAFFWCFSLALLTIDIFLPSSAAAFHACATNFSNFFCPLQQQLHNRRQGNFERKVRSQEFGFALVTIKRLDSNCTHQRRNENTMRRNLETPQIKTI